MMVLRIFINEEESEIWDAEEFIDKGTPINLIDSLSVFFEHHAKPDEKLLFKFEEMSDDQYDALLDEWEGIPLPTRIEKRHRRVQNAIRTYNQLEQMGYPKELLIEKAREYLGIE